MPVDRLEIAPAGDVRPAAISLQGETRKLIAASLGTSYDMALSARSELDATILEADRNYEMETEPRDYPWPGASNVFIPVIPEQVDTLVSTVIAEVFVPGFFLIIGNTPQAAAIAHKVQRFYNAELTRPRSIGSPTWSETATTDVHLSALHGTAYIDVTYLKKTARKKFQVEIEDTDPETGIPIIDPATGESSSRWETQEAEVIEYDDVRWEALELREVVLIPARAKSVEEADAVVRIMYLTENDLRLMSRGPGAVLWPEAVNKILDSVARGDSEIFKDQRGTETFGLGGMIDVTAAATDDAGGRLKTTEYEVLRIDSRQFDVNGDGLAEHMLFWLHRESRELLGAIPFPYHHGRRTTVALSMLKRPNRALGYGVPERLRTIQTESNATWNAGNDQRTIRLAPPRYKKSGAKIVSKNGEEGEWGPLAEYLVSEKGDVGIIELGDILPSNNQAFEQLNAMAGRIVGQSTLAAGSLAAGRKTKAEVTASTRGQNVRGSFYANAVRRAMSEVFWLTHWLKLQYSPDQMQTTVVSPGGVPEKLSISKQELAQDFDLLIAGMGGPMDKDGDRQDAMLLHQLFANRPDFQADPLRQFYLDLMVLDAFQRPDSELILGTPEQAQQRAEQQKQAHAAQAQHQQQIEMMEAQKGQGHAPAAPQPPHPTGGLGGQPGGFGR